MRDLVPAPTSGWDSLARYLVGLVHPLPSDLDLVCRYLNLSFGLTTAEDFLYLANELWPERRVMQITPPQKSPNKEWRLSTAGVSEAVRIVTKPESSWRRPLSRAVLVALLAARAVPPVSTSRSKQTVADLESPYLDSLTPSRSFATTEEVQVIVDGILRASENGDPVGAIFRGIRSGLSETSIGRVLWRLQDDGLVRKQEPKKNQHTPVMLPLPHDLRRRWRKAGQPPLSPLGEKLLSVRRRNPAHRSFASIDKATAIARHILTLPDSELGGLSVEHVIRIPEDPEDPIIRRIDLAVWLDAFDPERPPIWVEIVGSRTTSGQGYMHLPTHLSTAGLASRLWEMPILCYIVMKPSDRILEFTLAAIEDLKATAAPGTHVTVKIMNLQSVTTQSIIQAPALFQERVIRKKS